MTTRTVKQLACVFGWHDWRSTEIGRVLEETYQAGPHWVIHQMPRTFWENECARCGKVVGPTWRYERTQLADGQHMEEAK